MKNKKWKSTSNCVFEHNYHLVWSTKYRKLILQNYVQEIKANFERICKDFGYELILQEIMPDHVHLFVSIPPAEAVSSVVKKLKGISAKYLMTAHPEIKKTLWGGHLWNPSYYSGTAGHISAQRIQDYIARQKQDAVTND